MSNLAYRVINQAFQYDLNSKKDFRLTSNIQKYLNLNIFLFSALKTLLQIACLIILLKIALFNQVLIENIFVNMGTSSRPVTAIQLIPLISISLFILLFIYLIYSFFISVLFSIEVSLLHIPKRKLELKAFYTSCFLIWFAKLKILKIRFELYVNSFMSDTEPDSPIYKAYISREACFRCLLISLGYKSKNFDEALAQLNQILKKK